MTKEKCLFFSIGFFYILSRCQRNQNISRIPEGHSIKNRFSRTQKTLSSGLAEKESDWLETIGQTTKKAVTKVVNKKLYWEINTQRIYNIQYLLERAPILERAPPSN